VEDALAALPWPFRRRLVLTLQSLKAFCPDTDVRDAAEFFQLKAARVGVAMPFQGHSIEEALETTIFLEQEGRRSRAARGAKP